MLFTASISYLNLMLEKINDIFLLILDIIILKPFQTFIIYFSFHLNTNMMTKWAQTVVDPAPVNIWNRK